ncbi:MAG: hypothetical protein ACRDPC_11325 [Solirubrobacteraceae bacterium]
MNEQTTPGAVQQIRDLVALGASLVGLIYVSGVLIVGLRLWFERLPPFAAVGSIPKETAITIGLVQVFAPAILLGAAFLVWITTRILDPKSHYVRFNEAHGRDRLRLVGTIVAGAFLTAAPGLAVSIATYDGLQTSHVALVAPVVIGALVTAGYVHLRARIRERGDDMWTSQSSMFLRAGLFAVATVPMIITVDAAIRLPEARVCFRPADAAQASPMTGIFVTQTDNRVYVGDSHRGPRRLHAIPSDVVAQVSVGTETSTTPCRLFATPAELTGQDVRDGSLSTNDVHDGSLGGQDIANASVTGRDLVDGSVTGRDIRDGSLHGSDFAPGILPTSDMKHGWTHDP